MVRAAVAECASSADRGLDLRQVGEAYVGSLGFGGGQLGNLASVLNETAGLRLVSARRVENACASGGFAFRDAVLAVASGACELADRKSTRLNSSHVEISYAVFCLKKK